MKASPPLIRVFTNVPRPARELVARFNGVPTANLCDAMDRFGALDHRIRPLDPSRRMCGPALTVRTRPGDNLAVYHLTALSSPGGGPRRT